MSHLSGHCHCFIFEEVEAQKPQKRRVHTKTQLGSYQGFAGIVLGSIHCHAVVIFKFLTLKN